MINPAPADGPAGRSGTRRAGDEYQDLAAWNGAMRVLQLNSDFESVGVEVVDAGNVDDVVLGATNGPNHYTQVKWATKAASSVDTAWLTQAAGGGTSILTKLYRSYDLLTQRGETPILELLTNRGLDNTDPLLGLVDGRTGLLVPAVQGLTPGQDAGKQLQRWARHLELNSSDEIIPMLNRLYFTTGRDQRSELERAANLMTAAGLNANPTAVRKGISAVRQWVVNGRRRLSRIDLINEIDDLELRRSDPSAVLLVQAIDRDPHPREATVSLDWVDMYEGDSPFERRNVREPQDWDRMLAELGVAAVELRGLSRRIHLRGAMRLGTFFAVGHAFAQVTGMNISYLQNGELWSSDYTRKSALPLQLHRTHLGQGSDVAVAFGISTDPTLEVESYVRQANIPVSDLITLLPDGAPHDQSVAGPGEAVALAQDLRALVRGEIHSRSTVTVHLFQAGPGGLSLLLGHRWNRVAPTLVYEDLGAGEGYVPAFRLRA